VAAGGRPLGTRIITEQRGAGKSVLRSVRRIGGGALPGPQRAQGVDGPRPRTPALLCGPGQESLLEVGPRQDGPLEVDLGQSSPLEIDSSQMGLAQVGSPLVISLLDRLYMFSPRV
jgi:hypothetical protein